MNKPGITDIDRYFWRLEDRYRQAVLQRLKTRLEHAGYKGSAFLHILYTVGILYRSYVDVPQLLQLITAFENAYMFDRRNAVSKAVSAAQGTDFTGVKQLTAEAVDDELENISQEMLWYWLSALSSLEEETGKYNRVARFLLRYYTLKALVNTYEPEFREEQMALEAANSKAVEEYERQNEAAERIGKRVFPELFINGYENSLKEQQEHALRHTTRQPIRELKRMEWLGSQKELAELLIELERKGWIREKITETVQSCFTGGDSIGQLFKPYKDEDTGEASYAKVFTGKYTPRFKGMRENKKNNL
ncbi:hypothetical protein GCM10027443_22960 [Pontibacter brevis]